MRRIRQASFAGGELSPSLYSRTDLPLYQTALRRCRNMIPTPEGILVNRPGFQYVAATKTHTKVSRLIPFVFSNDQSYVLEFGNLYIRVHYRGAPLLVDGWPVEVVTTYLEVDLFRLRFAQSGDILTIVHPSYPPRELRRTAHTTWAIADVPVGGTSAPTGLGADPDHPLDFTGDATHPPKEWTWAVTAISEYGESEPDYYTPSSKVALYNHEGGYVRPAYLRWVSGLGVGEFNVYRGRNGLLGYVGKSKSAAAPGGYHVFRDDAQAPDYSRQPPASNPFNGAGTYPSVVTYFEQRIVYGNSLDAPATLWGSRTGCFYDFGNVLRTPDGPPADDEAIIFALATRQFEEVRGLVPVRVLLALTSGAEWAIGSGSGDPLTATNLVARPQSHRGASWLAPLVVGDIALFVQERGSLVHDLLYSQERGGYSGNELTVFARHLVDGHALTDWAYTQTPYSVVWAVRDDGVLLGLTYHRESNTYAWHWHDTQGAFESVCVVPEGTEDVLYAIVRRTVGGATKRYVERMATRRVTDARQGIFLDSSTSFDGRNLDASGWVRLLSSTTWTAGGTITMESWALPFVVGSVVVLWPDGTGGNNVVRIHITSVDIPGDSRAFAEGTILVGTVPVNYRTGVATTAAWATTLRTATLAHLNGLHVAFNVDGSSFTPTSPVTANIVNLDTPAVVATGGLTYISEIELLDLFVARGQLKLVQAVGFELELATHESNPMLGEVFDELRSWTYPGQYAAKVDGLVPLVAVTSTSVPVTSSSWNLGGRAVLRHTAPLPLKVLGLWREVELED